MPADLKSNRSYMLKWWAAFIISSVIVILATLPPLLPVEWRALLMMSFSTVCHQIPERSPHINGVVLTVCHRCYGVYLGLPLAMLAFVAFRSIAVSSNFLRMLLFGSLGLLTFDWGAPLIGLWHNTPVTRLGSGLLFGLMAGYYLGSALLGIQKSDDSDGKQKDNVILSE